MALGRITTQPQLLDTLYELNNLIKSISSGDVKSAIDEIKINKLDLEKEQKAHDLSRAANEVSAAKLSAVTDENEKFIIAARKEKELLDSLKRDLDIQEKKLENDRKELENAKKDHETHVKAVNAELNAKSGLIANKEAAAQELHKIAASIKAEYEEKMANLKKITG